MAGGRRGWFRSSESPQWVEQARASLSTAFLDMDRRQSLAQTAANAADQLFPQWQLGRQWAATRAHCYTAAEAYMTLLGQLDAAIESGARVPGGAQSADRVVRQLTAAAHEVDRFYQGNERQLTEAMRVRDLVPTLAQRVRAVAVQERRQAAESEYAHYPSVRQGLAEVAAAQSALDAAAAEDLGQLRTCANRLEVVAKQLADVLAAAPGQGPAARNAISSVSTRLAAVRTRAHRLPPAFSALLREFHAASSADLTDNDRTSQRDIAAAEEALSSARAAAPTDPESALTWANQARAHLSEAEQLVDAVTKRLTLLREVRQDPQTKVEAVRFRLRDAQMLAVNRGLVTEWGSVLDAQAARIERITEGLTGHHPDYWAYVSELDAVVEFISGVVERMRNESGPQRE